MKNFWLICVILFIVPIDSFAAEALQFLYIDGTLCVKGVIRNGNNELQAHLIVDLGLHYDLLLYSDAMEVLALEEGQRSEITIGDLVLDGLETVGRDISDLDDFTEKNALALGEIPVWGYVGLTAFDAAVIMMDIQNGVLEFGEIDVPPGHTLPAEVIGSRWVCQIEPDPGYTVKAMVATGEYESVFDTDTAALAGSETADFEQCRFAGLDVRRYTALRVRDGYSSQLTYADCLIANGFWQNFIVYWDVQNSQLVLSEHPGGIISDLTEQHYFNAFAEQDVAAIETCLEAYPTSRLAGEAQVLLLDMAVNSGDQQRINRAITRLTDGKNPVESAEMLMTYADSAMTAGNLSMVELFIEHARAEVLKTEDVPMFRGRIDACRGWIALEKQQLPSARRYLLSALFVNPEDTLTNYLMGCYHQANGELTRAWARYLKASLAEEPNEHAIEALKTLDQDAVFTKAFNVDDACDFLEGHILDEEGQLSKSAIRLKALGGPLIQSAIDKLYSQEPTP